MKITETELRRVKDRARQIYLERNLRAIEPNLQNVACIVVAFIELFGGNADLPQEFDLDACIFEDTNG